MAGSFQFLDDIAVADAAFDATGASPAELFVAAAGAVIDTMVDPVTVGTSWRRDVIFDAAQVDDLLFEWLSEIIFRKDADGVLFHDVRCDVMEAGAWRLQGILIGEPIDPARHALRSDVKAITRHLYRVWKDGAVWRARVVLDI